MSRQANFELNEFSPEISPAPAYYSNSDRPHKAAQQYVRERLIPRKPVTTPETIETPKFDQPPRGPPAIPVGYGFPQGYEHVQGYEGQEGHQWMPGFWAQFPWRVIMPLIGCLMCLSGAIAILVRSDGQPVSHVS
jgi:hypothetical protein